ncbi:HNH endonuclease [Lysinibacillus sphaericus]|uniref:HNH endonuclease n=1 Tax=Lysinibacillus sphaericus TaxID=1421 RepID=UPI002FBD361D
MIKVTISKGNIKYIKESHIKRYKKSILDYLENEKSLINWNETEYSILLLILYLQENINDLLVGEIDKLKQLIFHIETYYLISPHKLKKFKKIRQERRIARDSLELKEFISDYRLTKHLKAVQFSRINEFNDAIEKCITNQVVKYNTGEDSNVLEWLQKVFDYESIYIDQDIGSGKLWGAYTYLEKIDCRVCPYCDRQFVYSFIKGNKKVRAELDHFLPKSNYPYLGLSIFNLVPSCHQCNSTFKGTIDPISYTIIYPFTESFGKDVTVDIIPNKANVLKGDSLDFMVDFNVTAIDPFLSSKLNNSIELFALNENYLAHKSHIQTILKRLSIYTDSMLDDISKVLGSGIGSYSKEKLKRITYPELNITERQGKHVLSKLEFDLIEKYFK